MRIKLIGGFGLIITLLILISLFGAWTIKQIQFTAQSLYEKQFSRILDIHQLRDKQDKIHATLIEMLQSPTNLQGWSAQDLKSRIEAEINDTSNQFSNQSEQQYSALIQQYKSERARLNQRIITEILPLIENGKIQAAKEVFFDVLYAFNTIRHTLVTQLIDFTDEQARRVVSQIEQDSENLMKLVLLAGLLAIFLSSIMIFWIITNLRAASDKIKEGVNVLVTSGKEINASSIQVAFGSSDTANAVSETTKGIDVIKKISEISLEKAKYVLELTRRTKKISQSGKASMDHSIKAMQRMQTQVHLISQSIEQLFAQSQDIGGIVTTVNKLARQSNLLAVNTSIEASRAGEQGRGFAVVAKEVKNMAIQSKEFTTQVQMILTDIQHAINAVVLVTEQGNKTVEAGVKLSNKAVECIEILSESIEKSSEAASYIMSFAEQQFAGFDDVVKAMQQINQRSTKNSTSTQYIESVSHNLRILSEKLKLLIQQYAL